VVDKSFLRRRQSSSPLAAEEGTTVLLATGE